MRALLHVAGLSKIYPVAAPHVAPWKRRASERQLYAVDDISFSIGRGESLGLVGESGCGKSTVVRLIARLLDPTRGTIRFEDHDIAPIPARRFAMNPLRRAIQVVFQDPTDSLDPRFTAFDTIAEPIRLLDRDGDGRSTRDRVAEAATLVGLQPELLPRLPHQLSGGQKARVNIARAIAVRPRLLILDEPTSALDVSVQAVILRLLDDLRQRLGMSYLFVSHDLNIVRLLCQNVVVMYLGRIVEMGPIADVFNTPPSPLYARPDRCNSAPVQNAGGTPGRRTHESNRSRSATCRLFGRCPIGHDMCAHQMPKLDCRGGRHPVACHTPLDDPSMRLAAHSMMGPRIMDLGLRNKRALVTAASRGLGLASARALGAEGARVALTGRSVAALEPEAQAIAQAGRTETMAVGMDLCDPASIARGVGEVVRNGAGSTS